MHTGASLSLPCPDSRWCRIQISVFLWVRMPLRCVRQYSTTSHGACAAVQWRFFCGVKVLHYSFGDTFLALFGVLS